MTRKIELSCLAKSGASLMAIVVACGSTNAYAQVSSGTNAPAATVPEPATASVGGQAVEEKNEIVVVGTRQSQQSAINRKKRAKTATDSIVADDIGSFPDRNVAEAVSRVPGVALNRNEFGEGDGIAVRGNSSNLVRVEMDGIGVQSTHGVALGVDNGRSADFRELPAELVKSIDVVKGSTADMTEGGLGGSIQIKTRSGLDFKKPYYSLRLGGQRNSLDRQITPDITAVASHKFFGDRLGVIMSGTYNGIHNDGHIMENTTSNNRNYVRFFDFDNSPEKTFSFNPATVGTDDADLAIANATAPDGTTLTPRELVTLASGATTKAQCFTIFPHLAATAVAAARAERVLEQATCLNQWNDYSPSLVRALAPSQHDKRISIDARADFRVNDDLVVFVKGTQANRKVDDKFRTFTPGSLPGLGPNGSFVDTTTGYPRVRSVAPGTPGVGYYLLDPQYGLNVVGNNATLGHVVNVVPGSVTVDENHNVTQMTTTHNNVSVDQISNTIDTKTRYLQAGAEYRRGRLEIDAMAGKADATTTRYDMRTSRFFEYGNATWAVQPNGLWNVEPATPYDLEDMNNFVRLAAPACVAGGTNPATCIGQNAAAPTVDNPAGTPQLLVRQMPLVSNSFNVQYSPRIGETSEKIAKLDVALRTEGILPFITRIKTGAQFRDQKLDSWGGGGYTVAAAVGTYRANAPPCTTGNNTPAGCYTPPIVVPTANVRGSFRACQPTATSTQSCNYGYVPSTALASVRSGVQTFTQAEMLTLLQGTLEHRDMTFFSGLPNRGDLPDLWTGIDVAGLFGQLGHAQNMNFSCVKKCMASDGQTYDQPLNHTDETVKNIYAMAEFEQRLPLGLLFNGNVGIRGVMTKVIGSGFMTLNAIRLVDPNNPLGQTFTQSFSENVTFNAKPKTDWLPTVNLNLWAFDEKIVFRAYGGKTVARPAPSRLFPGGTCTIVEAELDDPNGAGTFGCSGRIGNPRLKPFTAKSYNLSLEWYPNKDTMFSAALGKLDVSIGGQLAVTKELFPFAGSDQKDPVTGAPLADFAFNVPTWENGPGYKRNVYEFGAKTAFTFLPWFLRHTGADANLSIVKTDSGSGQRDPETGDVMLPVDESKYYTNVSLWYDDGKLNLRVAYQKRSDRFSCITPCGGNTIDFNYPGDGYTNVRLNNAFGNGPLGYNPGVARFIDGSTFIDAKASYNITRNIQIYAEARNVTKQAQTESTGPYEHFADGTPKITRFRYGGRRIMSGVTLKFGAPN
ncbi:MAG: TonB-dependent receptor [Sphingomicrobium sp.]